MKMTQGDSYSIDITIENEGKTLDISEIELVEITLLNLTKTYPEEVSFSDGAFHFPLSQEETMNLVPLLCPMQVRVKFTSGDVIGSEIQKIDVQRVLSKAVL